MPSKKASLAVAAITVLPVSRAGAAIATTTPGSPTQVTLGPIDLEVTDNQALSEVTLNGQVLSPVPVPPFADTTAYYQLPAGERVIAGDIYFVNSATQSISAMIRFYPDSQESVLMSASTFSVFSFSSLQGKPDGSPFDATVYPLGVSAAGGLFAPTVDIDQSFVAPSATSTPITTGTYTFTFVSAPEPASASMLGIGAAILLRRRPKR